MPGCGRRVILVAMNSSIKTGLAKYRLLVLAVSLLWSTVALSANELAWRLVRAYPERLRTFEDGQIVWWDGHRMSYDDGVVIADYEDRLNRASLADQMSQVYPESDSYLPLAENFDPGRLRHEAFFRRMYGGTRQTVEAQLVTIDWFGRPLQVSSVNRIDQRLARVAAELAAFRLPDWRAIYEPSLGTYSWRFIAGTQRLSMHSFGAAIDLNTSDYWRSRGGPLPYRNTVPLEIVRVFEKYGFIWGGKWYHYDTMHFEYRPELINRPIVEP